MSNPNIASRFDEIYDSTRKAVLAFITSKCRCTADISDIFQDTYMELYQVLDKRGAEYITNDRAFVFRLARLKIARHYSLLEKMRMFVSLNTAIEDEGEVDLSDFEADAFVTEDFVVNQVMLDAARQFIQEQTESVQKVFFLFYEVDLTIPEVAKVLSMSESNVKHKLYRTLKELRSRLS